MSHVENDEALSQIALGEYGAKCEVEEEYQLDFDILSKTLDKIARHEGIRDEELQWARAALKRLNHCMVDSVSR